MKCYQKTIVLPPFKRGFHLITRIIEAGVPELSAVKIGTAQIFIHHTSASLTINENADPTVRGDFERHFNVMIPENAPYYKHNTEGPDDMPAHLKSSILGSSVNMPVTDGAFNLGTWQGIYLCEHKDRAIGREITVTIMGE
jgi:secondary thiamine-phosphate synthase enzyme